jgi:hypothetical protein
MRGLSVFTCSENLQNSCSVHWLGHLKSPMPAALYHKQLHVSANRRLPKSLWGQAATASAHAHWIVEAFCRLPAVQCGPVSGAWSV